MLLRINWHCIDCCAIYTHETRGAYMANQKHLAQLKVGVKHWNQWRRKSRGVQPDLTRANLEGANLEGANLEGANLTEANFIDTSSVNYGIGEPYDVYFSTEELTQNDAKLKNANLRGANLTRVYLRLFNLEGVNLSRANLTEVDLSSANLEGVDLSGADLSGADLSEANLHEANLRGTNLTGSTRITYRIEGNGLTTRLYITKCELQSANLSHANLSGADLSGAKLKGADLSEARIADTKFANVDLSETKGLVEIKHEQRSHIELHTIKLPQDGSALHFLRGTGIPDKWIDFYRATAMYPIQYHSCFISYSSKDDILARRLHADLQDHGVRCWFASEDMKIGDKIRVRIDEAIHLQDKLLLLLSEHAIASTWVEDEVEAALEKEQRQQREVLFPVRLDESVMQTNRAWAAKLRRARHIGDFTRWTDPQAYQRALERLLHDLKAEV